MLEELLLNPKFYFIRSISSGKVLASSLAAITWISKVSNVSFAQSKNNVKKERIPALSFFIKKLVPPPMHRSFILKIEQRKDLISMKLIADC